jgi:putative ABC transport system permease protein
VALLGSTVAEPVRRRGPGRQDHPHPQQPFVVVGVLARKGQSLDGRDQDDTVVMPLTTAQRKVFGTPFQGSVRLIIVQAVSAEAMDAVEAMTRPCCASATASARADDDFTMRNLTAMAEPRRRRRASCRCCSAPSPRCRCWSAASAS